MKLHGRIWFGALVAVSLLAPACGGSGPKPNSANQQAQANSPVPREPVLPALANPREGDAYPAPPVPVPPRHDNDEEPEYAPLPDDDDFGPAR